MIATILSFALAAIVQFTPGELDLRKAHNTFERECKPLLEPWTGSGSTIGNGVVLFYSKKFSSGSKFVSITILLEREEPTAYEKECVLRWARSMFGLEGIKPIIKHLVLSKYADVGRYGDKVRGLFFYTKKYKFHGMKQLKIMVFKF